MSSFAIANQIVPGGRISPQWITQTLVFALLRFIVLLAIVLLAFAGAILYKNRLRAAEISAPRFTGSQDWSSQDLSVETVSPTARVSVIIPAYNEVENIQDCLMSVLQSCNWQADHLEIWVVDDQSSDRTLELAQSLQTNLADDRLHVLAGQPRPVDQVWVGKNWACVQAMEQATGDLLLFLDADVRLKPGAIAAAVETLQRDQVDLLTCWPSITCGCLAEWLAQPLIVGILASGLSFAEVNDPTSDKIFAVGPFMLFRRTAYETIGGHQAVAGDVVEDVELARRIQQKGLKLLYGLGLDLASVQMYRSGAALWEGWSKNWHLGCQRDISLTLYTAVMVFWVCALPSLVLVGLLIKGTIAGFTEFDGVLIALATANLIFYYPLRQEVQRLSAIPPRYWWLTGVGGIFVTAIILASIIKTETGWGWTWRGRSLKQELG